MQADFWAKPLKIGPYVWLNEALRFGGAISLVDGAILLYD